MSSITYITMEQLFEQARSIRPDVKYVSRETRTGDFGVLGKHEFWAMTGTTAFSGSSPEELLANLLESTKKAMVA